MALGSTAYTTPGGEMVVLQDLEHNAPSGYLPGVSDTSLLDKFKAVFNPAVDSGGVIGGAGPDSILNSAASQDVPQGGDTRKVTDYTATTATPESVAGSPGMFRLLWNSITGSGPGLFSCREDSIICAGTGAAAHKQQMDNQTGAAGGGSTNWLGSLQSTLILAVVGIVLLLVLVKKLTPV